MRTNGLRFIELQCFVVMTAVLGLAGVVASGCISVSPSLPEGTARIPLPFWGSTLLLWAGSVCLHRAVGSVRQERQWALRGYLLGAMLAGALFVGLQGCGLWQFVRFYQQGLKGGGDELIAGEFATVFAGLHALHFLVALLVVVIVSVKAVHGRYDHEYYWGVQFCAWFWHGLGGVWLAILLVLLLITQFVNSGGVSPPPAREVSQGQARLPEFEARRSFASSLTECPMRLAACRFNSISASAACKLE